MRLDKLLVHKNITDSRSKANSMIQQGYVCINQIPCLKPSKECSVDDQIEISKQYDFNVSRGALKIRKALAFFPIQIYQKIALDIGSSTGGFTQVLLEKGASRVYALDVGTNQLHASLREDPRVTPIENCNARTMDASLFNPPFQVFTMDVSFISSRLIIPRVSKISSNSLEGLLLWKPQFEVGPKKTHRGIVKDPSNVMDALIQSIQCFEESGLVVHGFSYSPILGSQGNIEFLIYLSKMKEEHIISYDQMKRTVYEGWHFFSKTN
jgi:23S rRNA (cytidine1920-2'-O)/16S rRNA (cytidine1409-2'-O)-methyltransferase